CAECRRRLAKLANDVAHAHKQLANLAPSPDLVGVDAPLAYARFHNELKAEPQPRRAWLSHLFASHWRAAWGLGAARVVASIFLGFDPARIWAQKILAMLRVQKIAVVSIDPSTLMGNAE